MHRQTLLPRPGIRGPPLRAAAAAAQRHHHISTESAEHRQLRQQLGSVFPNALLLEDSRLPDLRSCRHFVNLTNGLDLAPLLHQLGLPFSMVRIRSTSLEQQAFESLLLELDANLLLHLALGHSCVVWDTGCRNRKTGSPRALWYGLEFIRFTLNRCWSNTRSSARGSGSDNGSSSADSSGGSSDAGDGGWSSGSSHLLRAHIRGHDVSRDFEAACRSLSPSTKTRLRYYKRYVSPHVQAHGVHLAGLFRRTDRDEDVAHFVALAQKCCGPDSSSRGDSGGVERAGWGEGGEGAAAWNVAAYTQLAQEGIGMFTRGLSHTEFRELELSQQQQQQH